MFRPIFAGDTADNWAKAKPAFQSSTQKDFGPELAVDGNYDIIFKHGVCSSTQAGDLHPWWMLYLQETLKVEEVVMVNALYYIRMLSFIICV